MPLPLETTIATPNAILVPQITIHTSIINGQLKSRANIMLAGAIVENAGEETETWANATGTASVQLDLDNIPNDIILAQEPIGIAYAKIIEAIGIINGIRKYL